MCLLLAAVVDLMQRDLDVRQVIKPTLLPTLNLSRAYLKVPTDVGIMGLHT